MKRISWRLHTSAPPETVYRLWATDAGRQLFWAESSSSAGDRFTLRFPDGSEQQCELLERDEPRLLRFTYFGSTVTVQLDSDGRGGTDLSLTNSGVPDEDYAEVQAGWLSVLLPLKAAADFGIDLRNHDPTRTWRHGYVDQ